jgi:hypothetical protein
MTAGQPAKGEAALSEMIYVLAASYDRVEDALADFEAVDGAYRHFAKSHGFDATVVAKDEAGKVDTGAVAALFPAVGILGALAAGGGAGAALGALAGHAARALTI